MALEQLLRFVEHSAVAGLVDGFLGATRVAFAAQFALRSGGAARIWWRPGLRARSRGSARSCTCNRCLRRSPGNNSPGLRKCNLRPAIRSLASGNWGKTVAASLEYLRSLTFSYPTTR